MRPYVKNIKEIKCVEGKERKLWNNILQMSTQTSFRNITERDSHGKDNMTQIPGCMELAPMNLQHLWSCTALQP